MSVSGSPSGARERAGVLILGAGQAGAQAASSLRLGGYGGAITITGEEAVAPYQRPPLSKAYLLGDLDGERLEAKPAAFYEQNQVDLILGARAQAIDLDAGEVWYARGARRPFARLILACGARPRLLDVPGAELDGVMTLRTRADADALRARLRAKPRVVVVGGGYIGLEAAAAARKFGCETTLLEAAPRLLARVAGPELAAFFESLHIARGVSVRTGDTAARIEGAHKVERVITSMGEVLAAELVVVGVGVLPNQELAAAAGVRCEDGVLTDAVGRTSVEHVFAIGDCARAWSPIFQRPVRFESVQNALDGAKAVAAVITGGTPAPAQTPWNWSDQYDAKLQTAGISAECDARVVRGEPDRGGFAVFSMKAGRLIACDAVNAPTEFLAARQMIARGAEPDLARLADPAVPMKDLMSA